MDRKPLISALVLLVIIAGGLYFVLMKEPAGEVTPENVPSGAVTKSGVLEHDETWSGEIFVSGTVEVPENVTLTIEPGTRVEFKHYRHGYKEPEERVGLIIEGKLAAIGTPDKPIWFTSDADEPINGDWETIRFYNAEDGSIIKYAIVEFAEKSNINMWNSSPTISHVISRWNNSEGIYMESNSSPTIEYSTIYQNGFNGIAMEQFNENVVIRYNLIAQNGSSGVHHMASSSIIEHNVITGNQNGISLMDNSFTRASYNTIKGSRGAGIWSETGAPSAIFQFNTIENNGCGIGGREFSPFRLNFNNLLNRGDEKELSLDEATGEVSAENNWWGTPDESAVAEKISAGPQVTVSYLPYLTERVSENPETGEQITTDITFDYVDLKPYDLGYTPGDQAKDRYPWVLPDDNTRRIVKRISSGDEMPWSLTWGDNHLWVANNLGVFKLDPNTGEVVDNFPKPGFRPWGMAFDGEHLWINDFTGLKVYEVDPNNGGILSGFSYGELYPGGLNGLAWDNEYLCLTNWDGTPGIVKFDRSGNFIEHIETDWIGGGLTFDGEYFWAPGGLGKIYKIDSTSGIVGWIGGGSSIGTWDLAWDGQYLWSGERTYEVWADNKIFKMEILEVVPWQGG